MIQHAIFLKVWFRNRRARLGDKISNVVAPSALTLELKVPNFTALKDLQQQQGGQVKAIRSSKVFNIGDVKWSIGGMFYFKTC
jgi:hypothetical protein